MFTSTQNSQKHQFVQIDGSDVCALANISKA